MRKNERQFDFVAPLAAVVLGLSLTATCLADVTWPDPTLGNPPVWQTCSWCQSQPSSCFTGASCGCGTQFCANYDPSWLDCGSQAGSSFQQTDAQNWFKCTPQSGKQCELYQKFYCAKVSVYTSGDCSGAALCSFWVTTNAACAQHKDFTGNCD